MDEETKVVEEKTFTKEDFAKAYDELCTKYGFVLVPNLMWIPRDDSTFSTQVKLHVNVLPKQND